MFVQNITTHKTVVELFQSGLKRRTNRLNYTKLNSGSDETKSWKTTTTKRKEKIALLFAEYTSGGIPQNITSSLCKLVKYTDYLIYQLLNTNSVYNMYNVVQWYVVWSMELGHS